MFCVDEVVVFNDGQFGQRNRNYGAHPSGQADGEGRESYTGYSNPDYFLTHILSYLETPPHLRKRLFPMHPDLQLAGSLPSLDMPHHLRAHEWCQYREGVTVEVLESMSGVTGEEYDPHMATKKETKKKKQKKLSQLPQPSATTLVDAGLPQRTSVAGSIPPNTRVTLKFADEAESNDSQPTAHAVSPTLPREERGYYWGYNVRIAPSLSAVFTECPFPGGYDVTFGTSERGTPLSVLTHSPQSKIPQFNHMLIAFGGVAGLEAALKADAELSGMGVKKVEDLFDFWVDLCPGQGSRTVRTEEAVWLGLMGLRDVVLKKGRR